MIRDRDVNFLHGGQQLQLPFPKPAERGVSFLRHGARRFAERRGQVYDPTGLDEMQADSQFATRVAKKYEQEPHVPVHRLKRAYQAMHDETNAQFEYLTKPRTEGGLGVSVEFHDEDPYPDHESMIKDVRENRRLKVYKTASTGGAEHEYMPEEINDRFRAVHDAFGHASIGRSFSRHGEEAAYHSHMQMYSPTARPALATESRAISNALVYGSNPGQFPEGKPLAMPDWTLQDRRKRR